LETQLSIIEELSIISVEGIKVILDQLNKANSQMLNSYLAATL